MLIETKCKLAYVSTIGSRIVEARRAAGFTTTSAFAEAMDTILKRWGYEGISRAAVAQWETGSTRNLRPENLIAVGEITGYSVAWIATGRGDKYHVDEVSPGAAEPAAPPYLTAEAVELAKKWMNLPTDTRELIARFVKTQKAVKVT